MLTIFAKRPILDVEQGSETPLLKNSCVWVLWGLSQNLFKNHISQKIAVFGDHKFFSCTILLRRWKSINVVSARLLLQGFCQSKIQHDTYFQVLPVNLSRVDLRYSKICQSYVAICDMFIMLHNEWKHNRFAISELIPNTNTEKKIIEKRCVTNVNSRGWHAWISTHVTNNTTLF